MNQQRERQSKGNYQPKRKRQLNGGINVPNQTKPNPITKPSYKLKFKQLQNNIPKAISNNNNK